MIQCLDRPAGQPLETRTFTASTGDDVTRAFHLRNAAQQWLQTAVTGLRTELKIRQVFAATAPANVIVRGTTDQIAAALVWMTSHNEADLGVCNSPGATFRVTRKITHKDERNLGGIGTD
jgi:hypothetical protein